MSHIEQALKHAGSGILADRQPDQSPRLDYFPTAAESVPRDRGQVDRPPIADAGSASLPTEHLSEALIVSEESPRVCTEQFRSLAAALHQKQRDTGLKTVMITSADAGEGKTFTAANLAFMLSDSYARRVLLIDADLRRPSLHSAFGVRSDSGLADALRGAPGNVVTVIELTPSLALMPAGTPVVDPMPLLTSGRVPPILSDAAAKFDWVIIDAPPVALLPDAALFASMVESVVLVVAAGGAPYRLVSRAVEALGRENIAGVVLNRIEPGAAEGSYDRYYGGRQPDSSTRRRFFRSTK